MTRFQPPIKMKDQLVSVNCCGYFCVLQSMLTDIHILDINAAQRSDIQECSIHAKRSRQKTLTMFASNEKCEGICSR